MDEVDAGITMQLSVGKVAKKLELARFKTGPTYLLKETAEGLPLRWPGCTHLDSDIRQTIVDQLPPAETREGGVTQSIQVTQERSEVLIQERDVRISLGCGPELALLLVVDVH